MGNRIIYIMGTGRSGTTLLDIILGNAGDILSAGELNRFTKRNGVPHSARDEGVQEFWKDVSRRMRALGYENPFDFFDRFNKFEYHKRAYNLFRNLNENKNFKAYATFQQHLFDSIFIKGKADFGKTILIDSSKYPLRGYFLAKVFGSSISFIYIKRSPSEVVQSFQKRDVEQPSKNRRSAHLYLMWTNLLSIFIINLLKKKHLTTTIVYDALIAKPVDTLLQIERDLQIDLSVPKELLMAGGELAVGPLFDGNRLRREKNIVVVKRKSEKAAGNLIDRMLMPLHRVMWYGKSKAVEKSA